MRVRLIHRVSTKPFSSPARGIPSSLPSLLHHPTSYPRHRISSHRPTDVRRDATTMSEVNKIAHPFDKARLEALLSRRFFYAPAFEIYGGTLLPSIALPRRSLTLDPTSIRTRISSPSRQICRRRRPVRLRSPRIRVAGQYHRRMASAFYRRGEHARA